MGQDREDRTADIWTDRLVSENSILLRYLYDDNVKEKNVTFGFLKSRKIDQFKYNYVLSFQVPLNCFILEL